MYFKNLANQDEAPCDLVIEAEKVNEIPTCNEFTCNFLNRSMTLDVDNSNHGLVLLSWLEETLLLMQPAADWDGDGLPNIHDLNPLGLNSKVMKTIN